MTLGDYLCAADMGFHHVETHLTLAPGLQLLAESDREPLQLRFLEEHSQLLIAKQLGTTQMAVSRSLARVLATMREYAS